MSNADHGLLMAQVHLENSGARNVCFKIFDSYNFSESEEIFNTLISKKIVGSKLWSLYKDKHRENLASIVSEILGAK